MKRVILGVFLMLCIVPLLVVNTVDEVDAYGKCCATVPEQFDATASNLACTLIIQGRKCCRVIMYSVTRMHWQ
jgi:hypothetical protein